MNATDPTSTTNFLHDIFGSVGCIGGIIGRSLLSRRLDPDERWVRHQPATTGTIILLVGSFVVFSAPVETPWGLTQGMFVTVVTVWVAYHSLKLYQLSES